MSSRSFCLFQLSSALNSWAGQECVQGIRRDLRRINFTEKNMKYVRELCVYVVHMLRPYTQRVSPVWQKFLMCLFIKLFHSEMQRDARWERKNDSDNVAQVNADSNAERQQQQQPFANVNTHAGEEDVELSSATAEMVHGMRACVRTEDWGIVSLGQN